MSRLGSPSLWVVLLIVATCAVASGSFWWLCTRDDGIPFLTERKPAQWIVYPVPIDLRPHPAVRLDTVFRRRFRLETLPAKAALEVRAFRSCRVSINGQVAPLAAGQEASWKQVRRAGVSKHLKVGENEITVTVSNDSGYPALWLVLSGQDLAINSDARWQASLAGATWQAARPAAQVPPQAMLSLTGDPNGPQAKGTVEALKDRWPALAVFLALGAAVVLAVSGWVRHKGMAPGSGGEILTPRRAAALVAVLAVLWVALFWNNLGLLPPQMGFDIGGHNQYIQQILNQGRLPLAEDGWQGYQPPLFYLIGAGLMWVGNLSPADDGGVRCLRMLTMVFGIAQFVLVFGCLRLLFPGEHRKQLVGLLVAAFLPMHLYVFHYVTNEGLAALLATGTLYLVLRILDEPDISWRWYAALGACLGAALLAKFSALLLIPVVLAVLAGKLVAGRRKAGDWFRTLGLVALGCLLVCGWHYGRVWYHYGRPLVGNWDAEYGHPWWQDPGFRTAAYYLGFGLSLSQPLFSAFYSFADAIYSTLWGDGFAGGATVLRFGPPWNWELMSLGYLLAIVPSLLLAVGIVAAVARLIRRPDARWFLMLALGALAVLALLYITMKLAFYAQAKAFYGMVAVVPLVACIAWGFDLLGRRWRWLRAALWVLLITWCVNSYASFWIRDGESQTHVTRGVNLTDYGRADEAEQQFREALKIDPDNAEAMYGLALAFMRQRRNEDAERYYKAALKANPRHADASYGLAILYGQQRRGKEAMAAILRAIESAPDHGLARQVQGMLLSAWGDNEKAAAAYREALRVSPSKASVHCGLGRVLARLKRYAEARQQYEVALRLAPGSAEAMQRLAWLLATCPEAALRDGPRAVRLAKLAVGLQRGRPRPAEAAALDVLAAAYAEAGRFEEAARLARVTAGRLEKFGGQSLAEQRRRRLKLYESGKPYRESR